MKKLLPKSTKNSPGFTLVELLIVIAIIAILATIGFVAFGNAGAKARDAKRKADIDQITKAYEVNYDPANGGYQVLSSNQFTTGAIPTPPTSSEGSNYDNVLTAAAPTFTVCARLEGQPASTACTTTSATCYCRSSAQSTTTATAAVPCTNFNNLTVGQSQTTCRNSQGLTTTIYVKCSNLTAFSTTTYNCASTDGVAGICQFLPSGTSQSIPYYTSATATTTAGTFTPLDADCTTSGNATVVLRAE